MMAVSDSILEVNVVYGHIETGRQLAYDFAIPQNYVGYETCMKKRLHSSTSDLETDVADAKRRLMEKQQRTHPPGTPDY